MIKKAKARYAVSKIAFINNEFNLVFLWLITSYAKYVLYLFIETMYLYAILIPKSSDTR